MNKIGLISVRAMVCFALILSFAVTVVKAQSNPRVGRFLDESSMVLTINGATADFTSASTSVTGR